MTHYRKFTIKKNNNGDFNFFECFKFPALEFKMEKKMLKGDKIGGFISQMPSFPRQQEQT